MAYQMKTKIVTATIIKVDYSEVEKAINEHYGFNDYSLASAEEISNGVSLEWDIDGEVDDYAAKEVANRTESYYTRAYMNDLARQGIIPTGTYLIDVSW